MEGCNISIVNFGLFNCEFDFFGFGCSQCVLIEFPTSSQSVLPTSFSGSPCVPQHVPNSTSLCPISFAVSSTFVTYRTIPIEEDYKISIFWGLQSLTKFYSVMGQSMMPITKENNWNSRSDITNEGFALNFLRSKIGKFCLKHSKCT
jgi:hypothetical protein